MKRKFKNRRRTTRKKRRKGRLQQHASKNRHLVAYNDGSPHKRLHLSDKQEAKQKRSSQDERKIGVIIINQQWDGNSSSTANDDEEYVDEKDDSPNETPDVVETCRMKLNFGRTSSKSSSTSKHKNHHSVDSVVEEVMQQNADRQEKLLEMQQQRLEYK